jgi:uncharacterized protein
MRLIDEEIFILPKDLLNSTQLIYVPKRGFVDSLDLETSRLITDLFNVNPEALKNSLPLNTLYKRIISYPLKDLDTMKKGFPDLNIDLSDGCNMQCIYCYAGRGNGSIKFQSKENIQLILKTYFNHIINSPNFEKGKSCSIVFSNDAEPTLSTSLLKYTVNSAIELGNNANVVPTFSMPSNCGYQEDLNPFIIKHFSNISCSFDGLPWVQNIHRPFSKGPPSFDVVYKNIKKLYQNGMKMAFNVVVTSHNLFFLKETIDFFHENFNGCKVSFSQVNLTGRALQEQKNIGIDQEVYDDQLMKAIEYATKTSISVFGKHGFNIQNPRRHYCSSTAKPNWNVSLTGEVYACMEEKSKNMQIGCFDFKVQRLNLDQSQIIKLELETVDECSMCSPCFAKYMCVGGCIGKREKVLSQCDGIKQRCLFIIRESYEKALKIKAKALFEIT